MRAIFLDQNSLLASSDFSVIHPADRNPAFVIIIRKVKYQNLQRSIGISVRMRNFFNNQIKKRNQIFSRDGCVKAGDAGNCRSIDDWEIKLIIRRSQRHEKIKCFINHFLGPRIRTVYFINHHNRLMSELQGFLEHEFCLRHRPFLGINQMQNAVRHTQNSFHFSAKVSVPGRVNDIYPYIFIQHGSIFSFYGNASFLFQIH